MSESEIKACRAEQSSRVMPLIGCLLDAWDALPNDIKEDTEILHFAEQVETIDNAIEQAAGNRNVRLIESYEVTRKCGHVETYPNLPYEHAVKMTRRICSNCAMESPQ